MVHAGVAVAHEHGGEVHGPQVALEHLKLALVRQPGEEQAALRVLVLAELAGAAHGPVEDTAVAVARPQEAHGDVRAA